MPYSKPLEEIAFPHEPQIVRAALSVLGRDPHSPERPYQAPARRPGRRRTTRGRDKRTRCGPGSDARDRPGARDQAGIAMSEIVMPRLSDTMEEGTILRWLKHDGEHVARGEELVEIETDKAAMTYESDSEGMLQTVAREGDTLAVGEPIARVGEATQRRVRRTTARPPQQNEPDAGHAECTGHAGRGAPLTSGRQTVSRRASRDVASSCHASRQASASRHLRSPGASRARRASISAGSPAADRVGASSRPTWRSRVRPPSLPLPRASTDRARPLPPRPPQSRPGRSALRSKTWRAPRARRPPSSSSRTQRTIAQAHGRVQGDDPRLHADAPTSTWSAACDLRAELKRLSRAGDGRTRRPRPTTT